METLRNLKKTLAESIEDEMDYLRETIHPEDKLQELVDSTVPIYHSDLIDCLKDTPGLAQVEEPGLLPEKPGVYETIQIAIYEELIVHAHEVFQELKEELECEEE